MSHGTSKNQCIREILQKFPHLGNRTIARIVLHDYGDQHDNDIEKVRGIVRYLRGAHGEINRKKVGLSAPTTPPLLPQTWRTVRTPYKLDPGLWLVINDPHVPFHETKPLEAAINHGKKNKVDGILLNGDIQDCAAVSFWTSGRKRDFDKELIAFIGFLDFLDYEFPSPKKKKVWKPGNHEYRLPRYYQTRAPELMGIPLLAMDVILDLENRGYERLEYSQKVMAGKLPILHGHEIRKMATMVNPARGLFLRFKSWGMCAHVHRTSEHTERDINGTILTTWTVGCLCDLSPDYDPFCNSWNWGFALINIEKNGDFQVENRRILPSGAVV